MEENNADMQKDNVKMLMHPLPLDNKTLKQAMIKDAENYYPEYIESLANQYQLDPMLNRTELMDLVYENRLADLRERVILTTLDEKTGAAYELLQEACFFSEDDLQYIQAVEGENADTNMFEYVKKRLENVEDLKPTLQFVEAVNDAELYLITDVANFNSYKANVLIESMENSSKKLLDDEGLSVIDFISSKLYRKLTAQSEIYRGNEVSKEESSYLQKVLEKTGDYRLISYCQNRLPNEQNQKNVIRAYQRALRRKQSPQNLYKINAALADLYLNRVKMVGFYTENSDKYRYGKKAIDYLSGAYKYADKSGKKNALKKMAFVYMKFDNVEEWKQIKEAIAMKFLEKDERCDALIAIADRTKDLSFYHKAIEQAQKLKMSQYKKADIMGRAYGKLAQFAKDDNEKNMYLQKKAQLAQQNDFIHLMLHKNDKTNS